MPMNPESQKGKLVIISGPSGCGKDTIVNEIIKRDKSIITSLTATTRPPRTGEINGVHYYFLTQEDFKLKLKNNEFIEFVKYGQHYYGTLREKLIEKLTTGLTVILIIDVRGAAVIRKNFPDALTIFVMPPTDKDLEFRLRKRHSDNDDAIKSRLEIAKDEMSHVPEYDFAVINDVLSDAVEKVYAIIKSS